MFSNQTDTTTHPAWAQYSILAKTSELREKVQELKPMVDIEIYINHTSAKTILSVAVQAAKTVLAMCCH